MRQVLDVVFGGELALGLLDRELVEFELGLPARRQHPARSMLSMSEPGIPDERVGQFIAYGALPHLPVMSAALASDYAELLGFAEIKVPVSGTFISARPGSSAGIINAERHF